MPQHAVNSSSSRQLRFLVVDDYEDIRDVFSCYVERAGHLACTAFDGLHALEVLQRESFDVMLLDLAMPRMGGVDVVRWLAAHPGVAPRMRTVVVTAWAGENEAVLQELGVDMIVRKPMGIEEFKEVVALALQDHEKTRPELIGG